VSKENGFPPAERRKNDSERYPDDVEDFTLWPSKMMLIKPVTPLTDCKLPIDGAVAIKKWSREGLTFSTKACTSPVNASDEVWRLCPNSFKPFTIQFPLSIVSCGFLD
jgi:hypothetical protein